MAREDLLHRLTVRHAQRAEQNLLRRLRTLDSVSGASLNFQGRTLLNFSSNDYLGLAAAPEVIAALQKTASETGVGSTAAHLVCGHHREHAALEEELADWLQRPRALLFTSGYMANLGVISALLQRGDICVQDKLNHASLLDAAALSGAELKRYQHADIESAQRQLQSNEPAAALVVSDGVFSMDGDIAPLSQLAALAKNENATLMIDDAHGIGVLGAQGRGSVHAADLSQQDVPVLMVTLGKALGTFGAAVAASEALIDGLLQFSRTYIYTTATPPALASASRAAIRLAREQEWRREHLQALITQFRNGAAQLELQLMPSTTPIQPIVLSDAARTLAWQTELMTLGIYCIAIRPPTVPEGAARLRICLSAAHQSSDIETLLKALESVQQKERNTTLFGAINAS